MKLTIKTEIIPLLVILATVLVGFYFFLNLPPIVPTHWGINGQVDAWGSRNITLFLPPALIIGMYLLFLILPYLDPKKENYQKFSGVYHGFKAALMIFFLVIYLITGFSGLGYQLPVDKIITAMMGVLFLLIGNYLPKLKTNWFIGIRTPWTLSSETVWHKTHQVGGKLFILEGILVIISLFLLKGVWLFSFFIISVLLLVIFIFAYSYWLYQKKLS
ncbi:MAG: SdpI family protein [bacterium]